MAIKPQTLKPPDGDTAEEITGILMALSIVTRRLAKKLRLLEQDANAKEGEGPDEQDE